MSDSNKAEWEAFVRQIAEQVDREAIGRGEELKLRDGRRIATKYATPEHIEEARQLKAEEDAREQEAARKRLQDEVNRE
jgi:hypothetical protein